MGQIPALSPVFLARLLQLLLATMAELNCCNKDDFRPEKFKILTI
jgi:hypothetical protein